MKLCLIVCFLSSMIIMINGHARIKSPKPLAAAPENPSGNYYNEPLRADGTDFPCKGLHKRADVNKTPTEVWRAGDMARFEILGHNAAGALGNLAAHSGGSCQASISFDNGETWKVLHSYQGGCPRGVQLESNMAAENQMFFFKVPEETRPGQALFSWTWIAVTGNRNEFYQNCASIMITGKGTSTLDHLPDMFVGDMTIPGHIEATECRSTARAAVAYPNPGSALTITEVENVTFEEPTPGKCFSKATVNQTIVGSTTTMVTSTTATLATSTLTTARIPSITTPVAAGCQNTFPSTFQIVVDNKPRSCTCVCEN